MVLSQFPLPIYDAFLLKFSLPYWDPYNNRMTQGGPSFLSPQIPMCQKKKKNKNLQAQNFSLPKKVQNFGEFRGGKVFWILVHREPWGWQERLSTWYKKRSLFNILFQFAQVICKCIHITPTSYLLLRTLYAQHNHSFLQGTGANSPSDSLG